MDLARPHVWTPFFLLVFLVPRQASWPSPRSSVPAAAQAHRFPRQDFISRWVCKLVFRSVLGAAIRLIFRLRESLFWSAAAGQVQHFPPARFPLSAVLRGMDSRSVPALAACRILQLVRRSGRVSRSWISRAQSPPSEFVRGSKFRSALVTCPGFILVLISPARTVIWVHVGVSFLAAGFNALVLLVLRRLSWSFLGHAHQVFNKMCEIDWEVNQSNFNCRDFACNLCLIEPTCIFAVIAVP
jgi:hypothetical protein